MKAIKQDMISKSVLAIALSKLSGFTSPSVQKEQYASDPEVAADMLWQAYMQGDILRRSVIDLGCGPGMLGIGATLLGAKELTFVDFDEYALSLASMHYAKLELEGKAPPVKFEHIDVKLFDGKCDTVVMNPPFGTRIKHIDRQFLEKAFSIADVVISFHKTSTLKFLRELAEEKGFLVTHEWNYDFPLKQTMKQHRRKIHRIEVSAIRFQRKT